MVDEEVMDMLQAAARDGSFVSLSLKKTHAPFRHGYVADITEDDLIFKDGRRQQLKFISGVATLL